MSVEAVFLFGTGTGAFCTTDTVEPLSGDYSIKDDKSEMIAVNWLLPRDLLINIGSKRIRYDMIRVPAASDAR